VAAVNVQIMAAGLACQRCFPRSRRCIRRQAMHSKHSALKYLPAVGPDSGIPALVMA